MSTHGSEPYSQEVRLRAVRLVCRDGWKTADVAKALGCSKRSVELWLQKSDRGRKPAALKTGTAPGATPKLNARQKQRLLQLLAAGPEAAGFAGQLWTSPRIADLIRREFGVSYHIGYLPTLLKSLGWSVQKPKRQALERDQSVIDDWVAQDWPRIKKKPGGSPRRSSSSTKPAS
jgi:transposase